MAARTGLPPHPTVAHRVHAPVAGPHAGEDGEPSAIGRPSGEYHILFGVGCESRSVTLGTGTHGGCTKQAYVPCQLGYDCGDCGRSHTTFGQRRRQLRAGHEVALPSIRDRVALEALYADLARGTSNGSVHAVRLPRAHSFWQTRFDAATGRIVPFSTRSELGQTWEAYLQ